MNNFPVSNVGIFSLVVLALLWIGATSIRQAQERDAISMLKAKLPFWLNVTFFVVTVALVIFFHQ